ncbi:MAG: SGNH/GDSL hydrolase family protein [Gammaproteobacteria bacterium]|nr:SGNH/GDSL hydrolase family protein [Gammaproteobacteria bacterium]
MQRCRFLYVLWTLLGGAIAALPVPAAGPCWVGSYGNSAAEPFPSRAGLPIPAPLVAQGTLRYRLPLSEGGMRLQIRLSNEAGSRPLAVGAVSVALAADGANARPESLRRVSFGGRAGIDIPAGAPALSDPVDLVVTRGAVVLVSVFLPEPAEQAQGANGLLATLVSARDATQQAAPADAVGVSARPLVTGIDVQTRANARTIVTLGDSITDGAVSTSTEVRGWPGRLAERLAASRGSVRYAVSNQGIGGNRLLRNGLGTAALGRFDRDVLSVPGVSHLIVLEGINDIGMSGSDFFGTVNPPVSADQLIGAYQQLIARAHQHGIRVYGGTLLPFKGAMYASAEKEAIRQAVNRWIRTSGAFDAVIDFEAAVRDPADATRLAAQFDPGDHLHPNDAGYRAMGDAVDLKLFAGATGR